MFRHFFGKHFCRFFSILGSPNGVKTKKNYDLFSSLFRTFRVLATFGRFLSIFIDFGPHGTRKTAKNRRISAKETPQISFKKTFHERWKKDLPHHQPRHQVLTTRFSPPDPHHQVLTTSATPPASHQPSSPTLPIQWAGGGPGSAGSIRPPPRGAKAC